MSSEQLFIIATVTPFLAMIGNYFFLFVFHRWLKFRTKSIVVMLLLLMLLIPIYGVLGFFIPQNIPLGVKTITEMYLLGSYYGFLLGALQSFSRVLFAELIPPGASCFLNEVGGRGGDGAFID